MRYNDGALYAWDGVGINIWTWLVGQSDKSTGKAIRKIVGPRKGLFITKGVMPHDSQQVISAGTIATAPADNAPPSAGVLNVLTEEADKCCRKSVGAFLERWPAAKLASCSECGTDLQCPRWSAQYGTGACSRWC